MIRRPALLCVTALAFFAARPEPSSAQTGWEFNVHGATLLSDLFPESGASIQAGARLVHTTPWRLTVGGNFDWARTREVVLGPTGDVSADLLLFSGEIGYAAPLSPQPPKHLCRSSRRAPTAVAEQRRHRSFTSAPRL